MSSQTAPRRLAVLAVLFAAACGGSSSKTDPQPDPSPACLGVAELCATPESCCSGICTAGECGCTPASGTPCTSSAACCSGFVCGAAHTCVTGDRPEGDYCAYPFDCATNNCTAAHTCGPTCTGWGKSCTNSDQCCNLMGCLGGTAASPAVCTLNCQSSLSSACTADDQCCSGYHCRAGHCQLGTCGVAYHECATSADCCSTTTPRFRCDESHTCACGVPGDSCTDEADCCNQYECRAGTCHQPAGTLADRAVCLDGTDCASGSCQRSDPLVAFGQCCTRALDACTAGTFCCNPTGALVNACRAVSGTCDACRTIGAACVLATDCCKGRCENTACCEPLAEACAAGTECCSGRCGTLDKDGTGPKCCEGLGGACGGYGLGDCCEGLYCDPFGNHKCQARPGGACTVDTDCYKGSCVASSCVGSLGAPCGTGMPCGDGLACGDTGTCQVPPGGSCTGAGWCLNSDYYDTTITCIDSTCCLQPTVSSGLCASTGGADGGECCSGSCTGDACSCSGPYGHCTDTSRCCAGSSCVIPDPSGVGLTCCPRVGDACAATADCCDVKNYTFRRPDIACAAAGTPSPICCVSSGKTCNIGERCCSGGTCPVTGSKTTGTCP